MKPRSNGAWRRALAALAVLLATASPLLVSAHGALHWHFASAGATSTGETIDAADGHAQAGCPICKHFTGAQRAPLLANPLVGPLVPLAAGAVAFASEPRAVRSLARSPVQPRAPPFVA